MYPQQPAQRATRRKQPNRTLLMVLVSVLGVLALCLVSVVVYGVTQGDKKPTASSSQPPAKASGLDDSAKFACTDFAKGYKAAQTKQARVDLANKVNKWAAASKTSRIADMGAALGRGADGSADAWTLAADAFAQACLDAGWSADTAG